MNGKYNYHIFDFTPEDLLHELEEMGFIHADTHITKPKTHNEFSELIDRIKNLEAVIDKKDYKIKNLTEDINLLKRKNSCINKELEDKKDKLQKGTEMVNDLNKRLDEVIDRLEKDKNERRNQEEALEKENKKMKETIKKAAYDHNDLIIKMSLLTSENELLTSENKRLKNELNKRKEGYKCNCNKEVEVKKYDVKKCDCRKETTDKVEYQISGLEEFISLKVKEIKKILSGTSKEELNSLPYTDPILVLCENLSLIRGAISEKNNVKRFWKSLNKNKITKRSLYNDYLILSTHFQSATYLFSYSEFINFINRIPYRIYNKKEGYRIPSSEEFVKVMPDILKEYIQRNEIRIFKKRFNEMVHLEKEDSKIFFFLVYQMRNLHIFLNKTDKIRIMKKFLKFNPDLYAYYFVEKYSESGIGRTYTNHQGMVDTFNKLMNIFEKDSDETKKYLEKTEVLF